MAFRLATALPSDVWGPVEFLALRRLAAICFALVAMGESFVEERAGAIWGDVVVFMLGG